MIKTKEKHMTDFNTVLAFVTLDADHDQINALIASIKFRREKLAKQAKYTLKAGQDVKFTSRGIDYTGKIMSVRVKKATVQVTTPVSATYVVPFSMLKAA